MSDPASEPKPCLTITARSLLAVPDIALVFAIDVNLRPEAFGDLRQPVFASGEHQIEVEALGDAAGRSRRKSLPSRIQA